MREDEIPKENQGSSSTRDKTKTLKLVLNGEFETLILEDNPLQSVHLSVDQLPILNKRLVDYLKANIDVFAISLDKMIGIDSSVVCH